MCIVQHEIVIKSMVWGILHATINKLPIAIVKTTYGGGGLVVIFCVSWKCY